VVHSSSVEERRYGRPAVQLARPGRPILAAMSDDPGGRPGRLRGVLVDLAPLRHDRDFRLLWIGQLVSGAGRQVTVVALPFQLYVLTGSTLAVGLLALVQLVPILLFSLGGGAVADAVDRRRLLLVTQAGLSLASLALAGLALLPAAPLAAYYAVAFVVAGLGAVDQPARSSLVPRLAPRQRLPAAIALNQLGFQAMAVVGPAFGGLILATAGAAAAATSAASAALRSARGRPVRSRPS